MSTIELVSIIDALLNDQSWDACLGSYMSLKEESWDAGLQRGHKEAAHAAQQAAVRQAADEAEAAPERVTNRCCSSTRE